MIQVLLFARLRDRLGASVVNLELPSPCSLAQVREALVSGHPDAAELLAPERALFAINQTFSNDDQDVVTDRDEVALFPPMTGG